MELGDRFSEGRVLDVEGEVIEAFRVRTTEPALRARLGRVDPSLLKPVVHRGEQAQRHRILIQTRDGFVRVRTQLIDAVRGFGKAPGEIERLCEERYPETGLFRQVPGVGAITALYFVLPAGAALSTRQRLA